MSQLPYPLPPGFTGTFADYVNVIWTTDSLDVAGTCLVIFDAFLVFEQEIRLVWRGRWGVPTIIYLLNHYGIIIQAILNVVAVDNPLLSPSTCLSLNAVSNWFIPIVMLIVEAMLVMRVTALYGNTPAVRFGMWLLYAACAITMLTLTGLLLTGIGPLPSIDPSIVGCDLRGSGSLFFSIWIPSLILETTIVLMTLLKSFAHQKNGMQTPLLTVLMRDGFMYFAVVFALILVNLVICLTASVVYYSLIAQMTLCVSSVLCSRLFLNLRGVAYNHNLSLRTEGGEIHQMLPVGRHRSFPPSSIRFRGGESTFVDEIGEAYTE